MVEKSTTKQINRLRRRKHFRLTGTKRIRLSILPCEILIAEASSDLCALYLISLTGVWGGAVGWGGGGRVFKSTVTTDQLIILVQDPVQWRPSEAGFTRLV